MFRAEIEEKLEPALSGQVEIENDQRKCACREPGRQAVSIGRCLNAESLPGQMARNDSGELLLVLNEEYLGCLQSSPSSIGDCNDSRHTRGRI